MKKKRVAAIAATVCAAAIALTAYAYLNDNSAISNKMSIGENTVQINETYEAPKQLQEGANTIKKEVQVQNTGNIECYVRVFLDFSDSTIKDKSVMSGDGVSRVSPAEFYSNPPKGWFYVPLEDDEVLGGYFYYTEPLQPGESTNKLLSEVVVTFASMAETKDFDIIVSTDSVQTKDNNGKEFAGEGEAKCKACWNEYLRKNTGV